MGTKTYPTADSWINQNHTTTNYGSDIALQVFSGGGSGGFTLPARMLLKFDVSAYSGKTVDLHTFSFAGGSLYVRRLTQTNWTEGGVTWNKYDGTNDWTTAGGDYTTDNQVSWAINPSPGQANSIDITNLVVDAISAGTDLDIIVMFQAEGAPSRTGSILSKEFFTVSSRPYIEDSGALALTITTTSLANAVVRSAYSETVAASGGTPPYSWSISDGSLPSQLTIGSGTGTISGTQPRNGYGVSTFTVRVEDDASAFDTQALQITTNSVVDITNTSLNTGTVNRWYKSSVKAYLDDSYTFSIISGSLPDGLTLGAASGDIYGYPTTAGAFSFTVQADGLNGGSDTQAFFIVIGGVFGLEGREQPAIQRIGDFNPQLNQQIDETADREYGKGYYFADITFTASGVQTQLQTGFKVGRWKVVDRYNVPSGQAFDIKEVENNNNNIIFQSVGSSGSVKLHIWEE